MKCEVKWSVGKKKFFLSWDSGLNIQLSWRKAQTLRTGVHAARIKNPLAVKNLKIRPNRPVFWPNCKVEKTSHTRRLVLIYTQQDPHQCYEIHCCIPPWERILDLTENWRTYGEILMKWNWFYSKYTDNPLDFVSKFVHFKDLCLPASPSRLNKQFESLLIYSTLVNKQ